MYLGEIAKSAFIGIFSFLEFSTISLKHFQFLGRNMPGHDIQLPINKPEIKKKILFINKLKCKETFKK